MEKTNPPRILVAVPYHETKRYCLNPLFDSLNALTYPNKEIVIRFDLNEYGSENAVKFQREFFRRMVLNGDHDYLYFCGADTIPPPDVLETLVTTAEENNIKIVGGVYWGRHESNARGAVAWLNDLSQEERTKLFETPNIIKKVDGQGMDCVLIHRDVLEKVSWLQWEQSDDDYPFYERALAASFGNYINTAVQCRHFSDAKTFSYLGKVVTI